MNLGRLKVGDRVAFSAVTWATNVMPILQMGLVPVPIDVEIGTLNVSAARVVEAYAQAPFACLFITNLLGFCDTIDQIAQFCSEKKIIFLEDNCESLGSVYKGTKLGNFGLASTFSFFVGHHLSTIEGGMVATNDLELISMLKMVRAHGWDRNLTASEQNAMRKRLGISEFYAKYTFYDLGYNVRPTEIQGFLGQVQLTYLDEMIDLREKNFKILSVAYANPDFIPMIPQMETCSNFAFPIICRTPELKEKYIERCRKAEIEIRPIVGGSMTTQPFYKKYVGNERIYTNAAQINDLGFYVGNNPEMTFKELEQILATLEPSSL